MATTNLDDPSAQSDKPTMTTDTTSRKPLRLWPGVAAALVLLLARFVVPSVIPDMILYGMGIGALAVLAIVLWWLFFSRAPWAERLGVIVLSVGALFVTSKLIHVSIRTGSMGFLFPVLAVPILCLALVAWAVITRNYSDRIRRVSLLLPFLLVCGAFVLIRTGGFDSEFKHDLSWRWSKTHEERLLAQADEEPAMLPLAPTTATTGTNWPGFRGPERDGNVRGTKIKTDWTASPPVELWRRPIGPGWSSFAVEGDRVYTQEQRGNDELVACYHITTGKPVWRHKDAARFWESNAGPGPRATPTLSNGRVYSLGATGILNVLDAGTGKVIWSRNAVSDTGAKIPGWGISGSPLVVNDVVIVAASGSLAAYDIATGKPRWTGPTTGVSYSSPQLVTINGVSQILLLSEKGATSVSVTDGTKLWEHAWEGVPIVQPAMMTNGDLFISVSDSSGVRRLAVANGPNGWTAAERWTSEYLNPYFNDFVLHKGHAFGFDGSSLACINLEDGNRRWKGGKYGHGQLVLLPDQDLLLVLSEKGELALVKAAADQFTELARIPAIKGKTWNHPVLAGDVVLVRNGEEMAAFKLAVAN